MSITFQAIELACALQKYKSISKTAEAFYVSEPALSKQIQKLEADLGYPLIERNSRGCSLTPAGAILAEQGAELLRRRGAMLDAMEKAAHSEKESVEILRLGLANCYSTAVLPKFFSSYMQRCPKIKVTLFNNQTDILEKMCVNDEVDLIVTQKEYCDSRLDTSPFLKEETVVFVPASFAKISELSPYIKEGRIPLRTLKDYPYAKLEGHSRYDAFTDQLFEEAGFKSNTMFQSETWPAVIPLLCQGMCYCVMPDIYEVPEDKVIRLHIDSKFSTIRTLALAYRAGRTLTNAQKAFIETAQEAFAEK